MAVTRDSLGLTEQASVERSARRDDFPVGTYVRTRHLFVDNEPGLMSEEPRPLDFGQVRDPQQDGEFVSVLWSQAGCGCAALAQENPADLVKVTEGEFTAFVTGYHTGYNAGYDEAAEAGAEVVVTVPEPPTTPVWPN